MKTALAETITLPTPFAVGPVNAYLIPGRPLTLFDCGPRTPEAREALERGLAAFGHGVADIEQLVISHAHVDHFGLAGDLTARTGMRVIAHQQAQPWLDDYDAEWERRIEYYRERFPALGLPPAVVEAAAIATEKFKFFGTCVPVHRAVVDGDVVRAGDRDWHVLHTPGHTAGAICLYEPESGVLLSGDHLLRDISTNALLEPAPRGSGEPLRSLVVYMTSLDRIAALPVRLALPGHGPAIDDHRSIIRQRWEHNRERQERILALIDGRPSTAYEVCSRLFPRLSPGEMFLGISETYGHLEVLVEDGRLVAREQDGLILFGPPQPLTGLAGAGHPQAGQ